LVKGIFTESSCFLNFLRFIVVAFCAKEFHEKKWIYKKTIRERGFPSKEFLCVKYWIQMISDSYFKKIEKCLKGQECDLFSLHRSRQGNHSLLQSFVK
jgi:hypothetical protein